MESPGPETEDASEALLEPIVDGDSAARNRRENWKLVAQTVAGIVVFVGVMAICGTYFKADLERVGHAFVSRFGLVGIGVGIFLADAFSSPIPPQFFIFTGINSGGSQVVLMVVVCSASILAGNVGYRLATRLANVRYFHRLIARSRPKVDRLFVRYGYWAVAIGSVTPIPYSVLCYVSGLYGMPYRLFAVLTLLRIPRLLFFYAVIRYFMTTGATGLAGPRSGPCPVRRRVV